VNGGGHQKNGDEGKSEVDGKQTKKEDDAREKRIVRLSISLISLTPLAPLSSFSPHLPMCSLPLLHPASTTAIPASILNNTVQPQNPLYFLYSILGTRSNGLR